MNKLKAITRSVSFNPRAASSSKNNCQEKDKQEAVVGFRLTLYDAASNTTCGEKKMLRENLKKLNFI